MEDAAHDRSGLRVRLQAVQPFAVDGLTRVGMRPRVGQAVSVGWPAVGFDATPRLTTKQADRAPSPIRVEVHALTSAA